MKIAMIGQKSLVLGERAGGIERHVAEITQYLTHAGHDVTVYARAKYAPKRPRVQYGARMIYAPTIYLKSLETILYTFLSTLHALTQGYDIIHYHGVGPGTLACLPRIFSRQAKIITTFHSRDQIHQKWGWFARLYLRFGEWAAVTFPHYCIAVSHVIQVYCREHFKREVVYIPNGATPKHVSSDDLLQNFDLRKGEYFLNVGRIVPQKGLQFLIEAYKRLETEKKLVLVGAPSFSDAYLRELKELAGNDPRILFLGFQSGEALEQLYAHAYVYVQPSESEGLPLVVLEAMSYGVAPLVSDIPENLEAMHRAGFSFKNTDVDDLEKKLRAALAEPKRVKEKGEEAMAIIETQFNWLKIAGQVESVYITARH